MQMSGIWTASLGLVGVQGSMLVWATSIVNQSHGGILALAATKDHVCVHDPIATGVCVNIHGLYCHQGLHRPQRFGVLPRAILVPNGWGSTKPFKYEWPVPLIVMVSSRPGVSMVLLCHNLWWGSWFLFPPKAVKIRLNRFGPSPHWL